MIKTERLILLPFTIHDSEALFAYRSDAETNKYQGWIPQSVVDAESFIAKLPAVFDLPESWFQLAIRNKQTNELIGDLGIHFMGDDQQQCELGCTIGKAWHNQGFATEAMQAIINHLFTERNKHRISASVDPNNTASIKLLERLGFRKEAHFKKSLFLNGTWVDDVIYGLLQEEWNFGTKNSES